MVRTDAAKTLDDLKAIRSRHKSLALEATVAVSEPDDRTESVF